MWARMRVLAATALLASSRLASADTGPAGAPAVVPEAPHPFGERTRADGAVVASVADEDLARWDVGGSANPAYVSNRPGFHVAPRVVVDIAVRPRTLPLHASKKGVLSETAVLAQARNHGYWPFRLCFEKGLRNDQSLHGKTRIHTVVNRHGRVRGARLRDTELADRDVARCIAAHAKRLSFSPPPARRIGFDITVDLSPGDAPLPELALPEAATLKTKEAPADVHALEMLLAGAVGPASGCYAKSLRRDPGLWGRIELRVDVDRHGNVTVREHESRFPDLGVVRCTETAVAGLSIGSAVSGPTSFTWGLRFGAPPPKPSAEGIQAENDTSRSAVHSAVAEVAAPRLPLVR